MSANLLTAVGARDALVEMLIDLKILLRNYFEEDNSEDNDYVSYMKVPHLWFFQTLYESSIAFGIRKALQAEQGKTDMENYIAKLEEEKVSVIFDNEQWTQFWSQGGLEKEVSDLKITCQMVEKRAQEQKQVSL